MTEKVEKKIDYAEIAKLEFAKCSKDPEYFIQKYVYIQMTNGGRGKFLLYLYQKKLLHLLHTRNRLILVKSRQLGITTLCAAYALWLMIFRGDQSILALAPDQDKARSIIDKISFAYKEIPNWLLTLANAHATENNKLRITLENGSKAVAASGASKSARGKTATFLILDEAAFIEDAVELWGSAQQTLSTGGSAILLSTPNGTSNLFHDLYVAAEEGDNEFIPVKLKWNVHPDRDQAWRDAQDTELGSKRMASQECDAEFLASGDTYLGTELLDLVSSTVAEPVEMRGPTKSYWIWKYPNQVNSCVVILDTSRGDGGDSSGLQVIDLSTGEQVAELKEDLAPKDLARVGEQIAREYNDALLVIENTGIGETTCSYIKDSGYQNVFYSPKGDTLDVHEYLNKYYDRNKEDMVCGFTNSSKTRPIVLQAMQQALIDKVLTVRSSRTLTEFKSFIWKNGKPQAANGHHDDLVLPLAIGIHLRDTAIHFQSQGMNVQRAVLNGIKRTLVNNAYRTSAAVITNPYEMLNPYTGEIEDISWLRS